MSLRAPESPAVLARKRHAGPSSDRRFSVKQELTTKSVRLLPCQGPRRRGQSLDPRHHLILIQPRNPSVPCPAARRASSISLSFAGDSAPARSIRSSRLRVVSQVHGVKPGRGNASRSTPSKGSPSRTPTATSTPRPEMSAPPERRPASRGTRMALLPTAARRAVAHRTRPTRPRLAACVLQGTRWQANTTPAAAGSDAALPAARTAAPSQFRDLSSYVRLTYAAAYEMLGL